MRLGLDHSDDLLVDIQEVVRAAVTLLHHDLATSHALGGEKVQVLLVLDRPAGISKLAIDEHACTLLRRQIRIVITGIHRAPAYGRDRRTS